MENYSQKKWKPLPSTKEQNNTFSIFCFSRKANREPLLLAEACMAVPEKS